MITTNVTAPKPKLKKITDEEWKTVANSNEKYEVSNYGRIKSYYSSKPEGKYVKLGEIKGYKSVNLIIGGKKKTCLVHKLVAEAFIPRQRECENVVCHLNWDKGNNHTSNLKWLSREESFERSKSKLIEARKKKGRIVTHSKLTLEDVDAIKTMLSKGYKQKIIAQLFCVSEMQISRIKNNISWATR